MATPVRPLRETRPRLYHAVGDDDYQFPPPTDPIRKRILRNIVADCEEFQARRPPKRIPERPHSPHPFHQLYITWYTSMEATAMIEQYSFAWRMTGDERWLAKAKEWLLAAAGWEHSDRVEEHFYTANRYMQAFAVALDWLAGALTGPEEQKVVNCLVQLLKRWWPEVNQGRHSAAAGHHPVVDNGHFGVAAIQLLGRHPDAAEWVQAVIDRFRAAIMPNGCGKAGEAVDGPTFWGAENAWMLHFADALRNVVGIDLYKEFPKRLTTPLTWIRYHLVLPRKILDERYPKANANLLTGAGTNQLDECSPVLLRLAQEAGDAGLRDIALRDPRLGRIHCLGVGTKNASAECMYALGPYAYMYYDPDFKARVRKASLPPSRTFTGARDDRWAILRSSWETRSLVALISGYSGRVAHGYSNLHVQWAGHPLLRTIGAAEASPTGCGSLPCVGGQNEYVAQLRGLKRHEDFDTIAAESRRVRHEYWLLRGKTPALLVALKRKPRGAKLLSEGGEAFARIDGDDYLQYPREPYFNPDAGEVRMRVRLREPVDPDRPQILFNTGMSIPGTGLGSQVNSFNLGFWGTDGLTFSVQSHRYTAVYATIQPRIAELKAGKWHDIAARWGGLNDPEGEPFIEVELDGHVQRFDDADTFGEVGADSQGLARQNRRTFYVKPNTVLAFGAAGQLPSTGTPCDIASIELCCPRRRPLRVDFESGFRGETGAGAMLWKLNPTELIEVASNGAIFQAGPNRVKVLSVYPAETSFEDESVPYYPGGLAATSRKSFLADAEVASTRVLASAGDDDLLVLLFAPQAAKPRVRSEHDWFEVRLEGTKRVFELQRKGRRILRHATE